MVLVLIIAIIAVSYIVSTRIHPLRKCPTCNMTGRHFGGVYKGGYRRCRTCDGTGRRDRFGTRVFWGGTKPHRGLTKKKRPGEASGARPRPRCPAAVPPGTTGVALRAAPQYTPPGHAGLPAGPVTG